jgi:predicted enzyme related to lactoylglutathione lyase
MENSMPTININQELTLALSVKDRNKSSNWYQTHLGFKETVSIDEAGWTEMATNIPGVTIGLGDAEEVSPGNCVPVFGVADIKSARASLEAESVKFDGETMTMEGMVSIATFYDPDGNALMIAEDLSDSN